MKRFIIKISNITYYKYGGNTRDKNKANIFMENELIIAENVCKRFKNAFIMEV